MTARYASDRYSALADRQARRWERTQPGKPEASAPAVAFSRLPGSGGDEVGRLVAGKLDYGFFSREIVEHVAQDLGVDEWTVRGLDERVRSSIERMLSDFFSRHPLHEDTFQRAVTRVITTLGRRGKVVLVGRGAPFIVPPEQSLRVLLVAPRELRIERYAQHRGVPAAQAEAELARAERDRNEFAQRQFGVRQDDPMGYDLVLNTGTLGLEATADLVVQALRLRFPG